MQVITPMGYAKAHASNRKFWKAPVMLLDTEDPITYIEDWWICKSPYKSDFNEIHTRITSPDRLERYSQFRTEKEKIVQVIHCGFIYFIISEVVK
jgi:hypothetical protein